MSHPVYLGGLHERANPGFDRKSKSNTNALNKDYCWNFLWSLLVRRLLFFNHLLWLVFYSYLYIHIHLSVCSFPCIACNHAPWSLPS